MLIKGTASWAFTKNPDTKFPPACWRINVAMSDDDAKKIKALGVKIKRNDDGAFEYKFKRNVMNKKTNTPNPAPRVVDAQTNPLDVIIGNGSIVQVQFKPFEWKNEFGKGVSLDLQGIQVLTLVPYAGGDGGASDEFQVVEDPDEFGAEAPPTKVSDEY